MSHASVCISVGCSMHYTIPHLKLLQLNNLPLTNYSSHNNYMQSIHRGMKYPTNKQGNSVIHAVHSSWHELPYGHMQRFCNLDCRLLLCHELYCEHTYILGSFGILPDDFVLYKNIVRIVILCLYYARTML